jgi:hypothetical protein
MKRREFITLTPLAFDPLLVPILCGFFESPEKSGSIWGAVFAKGQFDRAPRDFAETGRYGISSHRSRPYSALMLAALMNGHHFSISALWKAPNASGVC